MSLVEFYDPVAKTNISYHVPDQLISKWKTLSKKVIKENADRVYVTVGKEGSGKSFFTFGQAKFIDPTFNIERICFTPEQFLHQIKVAPPGSVVVFDEAFRGFSTKSSLSKVNKALVQAMMEVRRRNLIIFIVLPSFSLLEWYIATHRSNGLFLIYKIKKKTASYRGWRAYGYKKRIKIYYESKKNYGIIPYTPTKLRGKFFSRTIEINGKKERVPYETFDLLGYESKKEKAFEKQGEEEEVQEGRMTQERRIFLVNWCESMKKHQNMTQAQFAEMLKDLGVKMTAANLSILYGKTRKEGKILSIKK